MSRGIPALVTTAVLALVACNVQIVEPETIAAELPPEPLELLPQRPLYTDRGDPAAVWAAAVRRNLNFLTDPGLEGRRPGTDGAALTQSAVVSLLGDAGLVPSAPTLGWTSPVGIRTVQVTEPKLTITLPATDAEPEQLELTEGLWLRHRGAAGTFHLPMEAVQLSPQAQLADRLALGVMPTAETQAASSNAPDVQLREFFDTIAHRNPGGCLLQLPSAERPQLRDAAMRWSRVEVQPRALGSEPPAGMAVEGFVDAEGYAVLARATQTPGSKIDISFTAQERWFEDDSIVGRIAGRRRPEQVVLVTANWDAGGLAPILPDGGGAQQSTGLAVLLALVERVGLLQQAGREPSRSIVFVAAAGGSLGHLGLRALARTGIAMPENIVAIVHLDHLDWTAPTLTVVGGKRSTVGTMVRDRLPLAQLTDHEPGYGHLAFDLDRVPRVTLTRRGGAAPSTLDPAAPLTNLATSARVAFDLVWDLADASETPAIIVPRLDTPAEPGE